MSEIVQFRKQQALQEAAAQQGLYGLASGFSRHDFIEARAERGAEHILQLIQQGKHEQAFILMQSKTWGIEERELSCHTTTLP